MATKQIAWTTGSGYITLTYNGQGDGTITVSSDDNTGVAREQIITIETTAGTPVVTKNITIRQEAYVPPILNFSYTGTVQSCTLPPGTYRLQCWGAQGSSNAANSTYGITAQAGGKGGYSEGVLTLTSPTTLYIFVGGQPTSSDNHGGWNGGGGGSGTSTSGAATDTNGLGYTSYGKGGGGTDIALVTSTMNWSGNRTNRSSASLLSRFIVAGGGSGGAMALKRKTTSTSRSQVIANAYTILMAEQPDSPLIINGQGKWQDTTSIGNYATKIIDVSAYAGMACYFTMNPGTTYAFLSAAPVVGQSASYAGGATGTSYGTSYLKNIPSDATYLYIYVNLNGSIRTPSDISINSAPDYYALINGSNKWQEIANYGSKLIDVTSHRGRTCSFSLSASTSYAFLAAMPVNGQTPSYAGGVTGTTWASSVNKTIPSDASYLYIYVNNNGSLRLPGDITISWTESQTTDTYDSQVGYAGGGIQGDGYLSANNTYFGGKQDSAGSSGGFGYGGTSSATTYRYHSAVGGGGWYGGGYAQTNTDNIYYVKASGGGSGFVNISANSSYRPSGYTGLELDSGATYAGDTSFPSTSGSTETGHSGDGYARITCIDPNSLVPLTFDILGSGTIGWKTSNSSLTRTIQYKKNNGSWTNITSSTSGVTISVSNGDVVQFRGSSTAFATSSYYNYFTATCNFNVRGNIMSMFSNTGFESATTIPASYALKGLFYGNTYLKDASALLMPATTLTTYCYQNMFYGCTNMTGVPALPATTTQGRCYYRMFYNCSNITTAPVLNAATVTTYGYYQMFYGCSKLNYIKCLATSISASNAVNGWVNGVAATGTFVKKSTMSSWSTGTSGIPSGWTVQDA